MLNPRKTIYEMLPLSDCTLVSIVQVLIFKIIYKFNVTTHLAPREDLFLDNWTYCHLQYFVFKFVDARNNLTLSHI